MRTLLPGARICPRTPRFQSRHTSTPHNSASYAFQLHPDVALNDGTTLVSRFPEDALEASTTNMNAYIACYFEATLVNLLEIAFYHQDACEAAGDDALLELTDYCARALVYLNAGAKKDAEDAMRKKTAKELVNQTAAEELREKVRDARFATACCALTVLRYLTDYVNQVPLCVMARLLGAFSSR